MVRRKAGTAEKRGLARKKSVAGWLVGEATLTDINGDPSLSIARSLVPGSAWEALAGSYSAHEGQQQGSVVTRCRVLEGSGCASVCVNVCKIPTQRFFKEARGSGASCDTAGAKLSLVDARRSSACR